MSQTTRVARLTEDELVSLAKAVHEWGRAEAGIQSLARWDVIIAAVERILIDRSAPSPEVAPLTEHVLTTNGTGYFWCSCNPHRAHVLWSLNEHIAELASTDERRLELLRTVVSYDNANQSDLPLGLLDSIRAEVGAPR